LISIKFFGVVFSFFTVPIKKPVLNKQRPDHFKLLIDGHVPVSYLRYQYVFMFLYFACSLSLFL